VSFLAGGTYRFLNQAKVQPYVRVNAGIALLGSSYVETVGYVKVDACATIDHICPYALLSEKSHAGASWMVSLAGGFAYYLGPSYRVRMEGRDLILTLPRVTGPAPNGTTGNFADSRRIVKHIPVFMIGFDVLLERRHTRRY